MVVLTESRPVQAALFAFCALGASVGSGFAQQSDTTAADTSGVVPYKLEGVSVTVTRGREQLNRLPYAASILGASQIQGFERTLTLDESLLVIPGVLVNNRYNFALGNRISIRGFGSRSQFGVRGIRVIQDGIPLTLADGQSQLGNLDLAAAGSIEVIRGPASSLYGNAAGGVISVRTEDPPDVPVQPELRLLGGGFGNDQLYQKFDFKAGGRSGGFDYVGHLSHFSSDGYRLHSEAEYTLFNTRMRYQLDSRSNLTAVINYVNAPKAQNPSSLNDSIARLKPDTARDLVLAPQECPPDPGFGGCQDLGETSKQGQGGITYRRRLGADHEISVMGYGLFRKLDNPIPFTLIELDRAAGGARAEYRYAPGAGALPALTLGLDLDLQSDDRQEFFRDDQGVGEIQLDQDEMVTGLGLFAHGRLALSRALDLTLSARYDRVRFQAEDRLVTEGDPDDSGDRTLDQLSPMVGLTYAHAPWLNVYANVGRSFQTPTTTEFTDTVGGFNEDLEPERATNYEVGVKGTAASLLGYGLVGFYTDIEDQLIGFEPEGIERTFFENAGSSTHRGIEASLAALAAPGLLVSLAYTYTNFEFDDFQTGADDFSGNVVPGVPPHQFHGELSYTHSSGLSGAVEVTAVDEFNVDNANENTNDGYTTVDLRFGYSSDDLSGFRITPFIGIDNIFDVRYNSSITVNAFGGRFFEPAPGRNSYIGLRVQYR